MLLFALHVPYTASATLYAVVLAAVSLAWWRTEGTLSILLGRVASTFAMGTALGDFTAYDLKLGYFPSAFLFPGVIALPAAGYAVLRRHGVMLFWMESVLTRPLGASMADGLGKPKNVSGLGIGDGQVALVLAGLIAGMVAYLSQTGADVQAEPALEPEQA